MLEAIILAGGLGTRLASTIPGLPKALAPIQGVAFLDLMLNQLKETGLVSKAVLAVGFRSEAVVKHFEGKSTPIPIDFSIETSPLGTGGAILEALPKTSGDTVLILNGDCFCDLSFSEFYRTHLEKQADLTLAVLHSKDLSRYGSVCFKKNGRVSEFIEKTPDKKEGFLSAGIYVAERKVFAPFARGVWSIETDLFPRMLSNRMFVYPHQGTFLDIGTPASYALAQQLLRRWIP